MTDLPLSINKLVPGATPEQTVARFMAAFWGKTFSQPVDEENFGAQASRIVREIRPQISREALAEVRTLLAEAKDPGGSTHHLIDSLYQMAGEYKIEGRSTTETLLGATADLLARIWAKVNDGTLDPPNWIDVRENSWVERDH